MGQGDRSGAQSPSCQGNHHNILTTRQCLSHFNLIIDKHETFLFASNCLSFEFESVAFMLFVIFRRMRGLLSSPLMAEMGGLMDTGSNRFKIAN